MPHECYQAACFECEKETNKKIVTFQGVYLFRLSNTGLLAVV
jgi:hypothetical protein